MNYIQTKKITNKNIEKELIKVMIRLRPDIEVISSDQKLVEFFDSLDAVECIMEMEKVFQIAIHDEDAEKMNTIKDCCDILSDKYLISTYNRAKKLRKISEFNK